jgi:ParB-like chromosome segregation protein Spo0J
MDKTDMKTETVPIDSIHPDPANVRIHPERNLAGIKASLARFGQQRPILVDGNGIIRAGNGTHAAAMELGWDTIAIVRTTLKGSEATAYAIADNRTAELAEWDDTALADTLRALQSEDFDLAAVGYTGDEVDALIARLSHPAEGEWADAFDAAGDTADVDDTKQVTFVLASEDMDALMSHLKTINPNKNLAIVAWLSSSGR